MTVYVDTARNPFGRMVMCHMIADTPDELHGMADRLGMQRSWYQLGSCPHYDLSRSKRAQAVRLGAVSLDRRPYVDAMKGIKKIVRADPKAWGYPPQSATPPTSGR